MTKRKLNLFTDVGNGSQMDVYTEYRLAEYAVCDGDPMKAFENAKL